MAHTQQPAFPLVPSIHWLSMATGATPSTHPLLLFLSLFLSESSLSLSLSLFKAVALKSPTVPIVRNCSKAIHYIRFGTRTSLTVSLNLRCPPFQSALQIKHIANLMPSCTTQETHKPTNGGCSAFLFIRGRGKPSLVPHLLC